MSARPSPGVVVEARIERRLLLDCAVEPALVASLLPPGIRPRVLDGAAIVGVCLLRLSAVRPLGAPRWAGVSSDNVAHRIAAEWGDPAAPSTGVFVTARHTTSRLAVAGGGRLAPGVHQRAAVRSVEAANRWSVEVEGGALRARAHLGGDASTAALPSWCGPADVGLSLDHRGRVEAARMDVAPWSLEPVAVDELQSWWLDDLARFPAGSLHLRSAALQRGLTARWRRAPWQDDRSERPTTGGGTWDSWMTRRTRSLTSSRATRSR